MKNLNENYFMFNNNSSYCFNTFLTGCHNETITNFKKPSLHSNQKQYTITIKAFYDFIPKRKFHKSNTLVRVSVFLTTIPISICSLS